MSWDTYNATIAEIREAMDADYATAQEIYRDLREEYDRPVYVSDIMDEVEQAEEAEYQELPDVDVHEGLLDDGSTDWDYWEQTDRLDDYYFDDDWVDYGEEIEFTIEYEETR